MLPELRRYATLSHCWGSLQITRLLTTNQEIFKKGIQVDTLQPTFQHAIRVVRLLGLRYIWIDSLCIVQDSVIDWETESARMGKVYRHASINIAAASSLDARGGLSVGHEPLNLRGWVLQERLLSARTVHFTKSEIVWHCLEDLGSESVPDQCGLTKEMDKLVAIFGIAADLEQLTGDQCLAGLWRSQMPSCLLW
ncbi:heterokaryon incompatibility protein-domain-containing protein, partial [Cercophora newfieldiana]